MDDDTFQDMYNDAIQLGLENLEILRLAAAWCENIGQTSGPLGIGDLQAATGLPITGGSLRCEYATAPTSFGASLTASSVEFYERNCIGCPHRKPTGATEHLGTYADSLIAERNEWERQVDHLRDVPLSAPHRRTGRGDRSSCAAAHRATQWLAEPARTGSGRSRKADTDQPLQRAANLA